MMRGIHNLGILSWGVSQTGVNRDIDEDDNLIIDREITKRWYYFFS